MKNSILQINNIQTLKEAKTLLTSDANNLIQNKFQPPSLRSYWLLSYLNNYSKNVNLNLTTISSPNAILLVAPLKRLKDRLTFLYDQTSDYNDFFYKSLKKDYIGVFINYWLKNGIRSFDFNQIPSTSKTIEYLKEISAENNYNFNLTECEVLPYIKIQRNKEIINWSNVNKHMIKEFGNKYQKILGRYNVEIRLIKSIKELKEYLPIIFELHIQRWKQKGIRSKFLNNDRKNFTFEICRDSLINGELFFPILFFNNTIAAYKIAFLGDNSIYEWNTSFSLLFKKYSPGSILHVLSLEEIKKNHIDIKFYKLLRGREEYKYFWTNLEEKNVRVKIIADNLAG